MKRVFLDTEFTNLTQNAELLSVGLVAESGEMFYAVFNDYTKKNLSEFVNKNVLCYLKVENINTVNGNRKNIVKALKTWLSQFQEENIQMWADVPHYDWVLFCELFGGSLHLPKNIHFMCLDLATLLTVKGYKPDVERISLLEKFEIPQNYNIHNALSDAQVGMTILKKILDGKQ